MTYSYTLSAILWIRRNLWLIGTVVYVVGMYPIFVNYQAFHSFDFSAIDVISIGGVALVILQGVIAPYEESLKVETASQKPLEETQF